eukprot:c6799_g1_i2.p1 GENE.c6799_g1_i2~~c6799_g1_i2.p1  ORF type:complete len:279 (+),score=60.23 c6799_g1_i2:355-1191(+)
MMSLNQPTFRAKQIMEWVYARGITNFDHMTNLPLPLRQQLTQHLRTGTLNLAYERVSKDGTVKRAYKLIDDQLIESVLMRYDDGRNTACISSQAGCAMGCTFCATGQMGFARQLSADEIFEQVLLFSNFVKNNQRQHDQQQQERLSNVVFMGMGEPLMNYRNVMEAIQKIHKELGIGSRHITVSTVGIAPNILKLAHESLPVTLAVSLHAVSDDERSAIIPANKRFPIQELMDACRQYIKITRRRVTFEWALIANKNDSTETATKSVATNINAVIVNW